MLLRTITVVLLLFLVVSCASLSAEQRKQEADIHYKMGEVHLANKNYADALQELTEAVKLYPEGAEYHNALAIAYGARKMLDKAEEHLKKAVSLDNEYSEAYLNLGALYIEQKRWDESIEASKMAIKNVFYKTPELAYNNIGWALLMKGDDRGALEAFRKAVDLNTRYAMPFYNMALTYERMGRVEDAVRSYRSAITRAPKFAIFHMDLGYLLLRNDDKKGAIEAFEKVIELEPNSSMADRAREQLKRLK